MANELPQRIVRVGFTLKDGKVKVLEGLNVQFSVQKQCYAFGGQASISIANLTIDDINFLTTFSSPYLAPEKRKQVFLAAGYEGSVKDIYAGDIWTAIPNKRGADIWLDIKAITSYYTGSTILSKTITGSKTSIKDVCKQAANWKGLNFSWLAKSQKAIDSFHYTGSLNGALRKINTLDSDILIFEEDGTLKVIDAKKPEGLGIRLVSEDSGMIGIPKIDQFGVEITTLLDNTIKLGSKIKLQSQLIPIANGEYWVYSAHHHGVLRGNEFYSTFKCRKWGGNG